MECNLPCVLLIPFPLLLSHIDVNSSALPHPPHHEGLIPLEPQTRINIVSSQSIGIWSQRHTSNLVQEITVMENSQGGGLRCEVTLMSGSLSLPKMMDEVRGQCP